MDAHRRERWKAHFRYRKELNPDEWSPIWHRQITLEEARERAAEAAEKLERWGTNGSA